jgi:hypothetical protein
MSCLNVARMMFLIPAVLTIANNAHAADWATVASACRPDTSQSAQHAFDGASAGFQIGSGGRVELSCTIVNPSDTNSNPGWNRLELTFSDPDGPSLGSEISITLMQSEISTGNGGGNWVFRSRESTVQGQQLYVKSFSHAFDFLRYQYALLIRIERTSTTLNPRIQRLRLYKHTWTSGMPAPGGVFQ